MSVRFVDVGGIKWQHSQGAQDEDKQIKNTTQYVLDTTMRKKTQTRK
jgi:hypothetical protein